MYIFSAKKFVPVKTGHSTSRTQRVVPNIGIIPSVSVGEGGGGQGHHPIFFNSFTTSAVK